jgi:hypothetical protein
MDREMTLDELLAEPIVCLLMRRDGVEADELRALAERVRRRLQATQDRPLVPRRVA